MRHDASSVSKAIVLAGGFDQIALIEELKRRGIETLLVDYLEDPPARMFADRHIRMSTLDEDAVESLAREEQVDIIVTACTDQALLTMACVSERLGTPSYLTSEKARRVTNKVLMKEAMAKNSIPTARHMVLNCFDDTSFQEMERAIGFPLVVKPCDCNSSKGVVKVENPSCFYTAIENALKLSRSGSAIIESYIEGREVSIDAWVNRNSHATILSITETEKMPDEQGSFPIFKSSYPCSWAEPYKERIVEVANSIAMTFELQSCPLLIQCLLRDDVYVVEFSARMGGGTKYRLIERISDVDIMRVYVDMILGCARDIDEPSFSGDFIELDYLYANSGRISAVKGFEEARQNGLIEEYYQYKSTGSTVSSKKSSTDRVAGMLLSGSSEEELACKRAKALETIAILDDAQDIAYKEAFE